MQFFFQSLPFGYRLYASVSISAYLLNSEVPQNEVLNTSFHVLSFPVDLSHSMNVDTMYNLINGNYIFNSNFPPRSRLISNHPPESYIECLLDISNCSIVPYMLSDSPRHMPGTVIHISVNGAIMHSVTSQEPESPLTPPFSHLSHPPICLGASL